MKHQQYHQKFHQDLWWQRCLGDLAGWFWRGSCLTPHSGESNRGMFFWRIHGVFNGKKFEIWTTDYKLAVCCISVKQFHSNLILDYDFSLRFLMSSWNLKMSHLLLFFGRETKGFSLATKLDFCKVLGWVLIRRRCLLHVSHSSLQRVAWWRRNIHGCRRQWMWPSGHEWWFSRNSLWYKLSLKTHGCSLFHSWLDPTYALLRNMI